MSETIKKLREICQPKSRMQSETSNWIYGWYPFLARKVSIYITKLLIRTQITANQVTLIYIIVGVTGTMLLAFTNYWYSIAGVILLHFSMILDFTDGEIARYRKTISTRGKYFDDVGWELIHALIFFSVGLKAFSTSYRIFGFDTYQNILVIILTFTALSFRLLAKFSSAYSKILAFQAKNTSVTKKESNRKGSGLIHTGETQILRHEFRKSLLLALGSYNLVTFFSIALILNVPFIPLFFYGIILPPLWIADLYVKFTEFGS